MSFFSKKILFSFFILFIVVGIAYIAERGKDAPQSKAVTAISEKIDTDTDRDGLKDWEEVLWNTDQENADSDGDGAQDGEEILLGRNPAIPSPNDSLEETKEISSATAAQTETPSTKTELISRELFSGVIKLKEEGELSRANVEELSNVLLEKIGLVDQVTPKTYTLKDITVGKNSSPEAVRAYGNALVILGQTYEEKTGNEVDAIIELVESEDLTKVEPVKKVARTYKELLIKHLNISVPPGAESIHLSLANYYGALSHSLENLSLLYDDATLGLLGLKQYQILSAHTESLSLTMKTYFSSHTNFLETDPGIILVQ